MASGSTVGSRCAVLLAVAREGNAAAAPGCLRGAIAQRRNRDVDHVQAVVQILAERLRRDVLDGVAVGRRDHAHVELRLRRDRRRPAGSRRSRETAAAAPASAGSSRRLRRETPCRGAPSPAARRLSRYAPVKLPRTWPNSSDSSSVSGMPAQLIATSGACARALSWWIRRLATSLPTPLSPVISTLALQPARVLDLGPNSLHDRADPDEILDRVLHSHSLLEPPRGPIVVLNEGRIPGDPANENDPKVRWGYHQGRRRSNKSHVKRLLDRF